MYILVRVIALLFIALCLFGAHARGGVRSEPSLWSFTNQLKITNQKLMHGWQQNGNMSMAV